MVTGGHGLQPGRSHFKNQCLALLEAVPSRGSGVDLGYNILRTL